MKKITTATGLAILAIGAQSLPAAAQFVNWRSSGAPTFIFRSATPLTPGTEILYSLSSEERNSAVGTPNACGYKILSPGKSATAIESVKPGGGPVIITASLPVFDGSCKATATGNSLVPKIEGEATPTSHYKDPSGKVAIKVDPAWTYFTITRLGVEKKGKADACGNLKYSIQTAKSGQVQPSWSATITIPALGISNLDLENVAQDSRDAICSQRWKWNATGSALEKIATFFSLP